MKEIHGHADKHETPPQRKEITAYNHMISQESMDELRDRILQVLLIDKKYKDKDYTAQKLAEELHTNARYISAVFSVKFQTTYSFFINKHRVDDAMSLLRNRRNDKLSMEDVSDMVGFANRQTFYSAFHKVTGMTPFQYRRAHVSKGKGKVGRPKKDEQVKRA